MALDKLTKVQSVGISSFIQVVGVVTATGGFVGNITGNVTGTATTATTATNASGATGDFSIADKIVHTGDTNTAIRFPAADTFTVETAGSERLRVTSVGIVRIPDNGKLTCGASDDLQIYHNGSHSYIADEGSGELIISGSRVQLMNAARSEKALDFVQDGAVDLYHNGSKKFETTSSGVSVSGNIAITNGNGIDFSATGDASGMSSEILDDYEEGSWTPALIGSSSNPSLTYGSQAGAYEKIGTLVHASFFMQIGGVTSQGSGQLRIGGLPYSSVGGIAAGEVPGVLLQAEPFNDGKGANRQQIVRTASQNYLLVGYRDLTTANVPIPGNAAANVGTGYFIGHVTYRAA